ncbi:zinc ribbon domain-containing protein [Leptolyngbyaceae cyanobacterium UHCC 1019]
MTSDEWQIQNSKLKTQNSKLHSSHLAMPDCPKCHQFVESRAIACPYCRTPLKAHGHPGMKLFQATEGEPLCASCVYHADDSCNFPKRPYALDCTLYEDVQKPLVMSPQYGSGFQLQRWIKRNTTLLLVAGLLMVSLGIVLIHR